MTLQQTTQGRPITLPDPTRPPRPARNCDICQTLERDRIRFEKANNISAATACEVEMRNHPHPKPKRRRARS